MRVKTRRSCSVGHRLIPFLWTALSFLACAGGLWAKPPYYVMPYVQTGDSGTVTPAGIPWADITHLNEAFGRVKTTSPFASFTQPAAWSTLVSTAHSNNTRINISFGGAGVSDATWSTATNATNLSNFESQIMGVVSTNGFDGVDIDWEFPSTTDESQFMSLIGDLAIQLHALTGYDGQPKTLTFYISPGAFICGVNWSAAATIVDFGIQGGYDYKVTAAGAVYDGPVSLPNAAGVSFTDCFGTQRPLDSSSNIATIVSKGWTLNKTILGCPLYIEDSGNSTVYNVISGGNLITSATGTLEMESVYSYGGANYGVNDHDAFCAKINWAVGQMGMPGISMWELGNAYPATGAPVSSLWNVIGGNDACVTVHTPTPTFTVNVTNTPTNTFTLTRSPTPTFTRTSTYTGTPTNSPTNSMTPSATASSTPTSTFTATRTVSVTATPTRTVTSTATPTDSPALTWTPTGTLSPTSTLSPTPTASFTSTGTMTLTSTPTNASSPVQTMTGLPMIYPNPVLGPGPAILKINLTSNDIVNIKYFTLAFRKVNEFSSGQLPAGIHDLSLVLTDSWGTALANGLYYVVVTTSGGTNTLKLLIVR